MNNVIVVPSGPYILSQTTFQEYFIKETDKDIILKVENDINFFAERIAPKYGIELIEIPRKKVDEWYVSVSWVRECLEKYNTEKLHELVSESTWKILFAEECSREEVMFHSVISLGRDCLVASALSKYGLRSFSGPFDWCVSNFLHGVIPMLESDFCDFMLYGNLEVSKAKETDFNDLKYKIHYNHDVKKSLVKEYNDIYEKYQRRIARFLKEIKEPACFVRGVWSVEELNDIFENQDRIESAIKRYPQNEIVFVIPRHIYERNPVKIKMRYFVVDTIISGFALGSREESRGFFDTNTELIDFLVRNYDPQKRKDNLIFDLKAELEVARHTTEESFYHTQIETMKKTIIKQQEENIRIDSRNLRWMKVLNTDFSTIQFPDEISIYGCGAIGKVFYQKVKGYCRVAKFIDQKPRQEVYDGVPVVPIKDSKADGRSLIIIIPSYDYQNIVDALVEEYGFRPQTAKLEEFLAQGKVIDPNF